METTCLLTPYQRKFNITACLKYRLYISLSVSLSHYRATDSQWHVHISIRCSFTQARIKVGRGIFGSFSAFHSVPLSCMSLFIPSFFLPYLWCTVSLQNLQGSPFRLRLLLSPLQVIPYTVCTCQTRCWLVPKRCRKYVVRSKSFRPDIQKPRQMENAVRDI